MWTLQLQKYAEGLVLQEKYTPDFICDCICHDIKDSVEEIFEKFSSSSHDFMKETKFIELYQAMELAKAELTLFYNALLEKKTRKLMGNHFTTSEFVSIQDIQAVGKEWGI